MDLKGLRLFLGVLRHKSITRAAEHLYIAQPALGLQIRKLEEEFGLQLLQRHSRGVTPTEAGLLLAQHAEILLRQAERAERDLLDYGTTARGRVSIGLSPTVSQVMAVVLVERIRRDLPDVVLTLSEGLSERLMDRVGKEGIDAALTYNPAHPGEGIVVEPLVKEVLYFIAPAGSEPGGGTDAEPVTLARALGRPLVLPSRPHLLRLIIEDRAREIGASVEVGHEVDSVAVMKEFVRCGLGCSVLPFGAVSQEVRDGRIVARRIVEPEIERTLHLAFLASRPSSKAFLAVCDLMRTVAGEIADRGAAGWRR